MTQFESLRAHHARAMFVCQENYASRAKIGAVLVRSFSLFQSKDLDALVRAVFDFSMPQCAHLVRASHLSGRHKTRARPVLSPAALKLRQVRQALLCRVDHFVSRRMEFAILTMSAAGPAHSRIVQTIRAAVRAFISVDASIGIGVQITVRAGVCAR